MKPGRRVVLLSVAWLLASLVLGVLLLRSSESALKNSLEQRLHGHLQVTLDEAWFSATQARSNDRRLLARAGEEINGQLRSMVHSRWFAPHKACEARLLQVDGTDVGEVLPGMQLQRFDLFRNQIARDVEFGIACQPNGAYLAGLGALLGALFLAIGVTLPPPLSATHRRWINQLLEQGYSGQEAFDIVRGYSAEALDLNASQRLCLDDFQAAGGRNMGLALSLVTDPRVAALGAEQVHWLLLGLRRTGALESALAIATAENTLEIDLTRMQLSLRGMTVPMSGTPLFYYAWYAFARLRDDGWITNPASNRPDLSAGEQLAELMLRHHGHARAINDLEQSGLKARTLDQNRSKIKDDIVAVLGDVCAEAFLFDVSKHPDGVRLRYRLRVEPASIHVVTLDRPS